MFNKTKKSLYFPSINGARQHFKIRFNTISKNIDNDQPVLINGEAWFIKSVAKKK